VTETTTKWTGRPPAVVPTIRRSPLLIKLKSKKKRKKKIRLKSLTIHHRAAVIKNGAIVLVGTKIAHEIIIIIGNVLLLPEMMVTVTGIPHRNGVARKGRVTDLVLVLPNEGIENILRGMKEKENENDHVIINIIMTMMIIIVEIIGIGKETTDTNNLIMMIGWDRMIIPAWVWVWVVLAVVVVLRLHI
jgi:hypothetical protein